MDDSQQENAWAAYVRGARYKEEYKKFFMDYELKIDNFDILLLCHEDDIEQARKFQDRLKRDIKIRMGGKPRPPRIQIESEYIADGNPFTKLDHAFEKSVCVFLFCTKNFCKEDSDLYNAYLCLRTALEKRAGPGKWCVVPVYTEVRSKTNIPPFFKGLHPIKCYDTCYYHRAVSNLLESKASVRMELDDKLEEKRRVHFESNKNEILRRAQRFHNCQGGDLSLREAEPSERAISQHSSEGPACESQQNVSPTTTPTKHGDACFRNLEKDSSENENITSNALNKLSDCPLGSPQREETFGAVGGCAAPDTIFQYSNNSHDVEQGTDACFLNNHCAKVPFSGNTHRPISKDLNLLQVKQAFSEDRKPNDQNSSGAVQYPDNPLRSGEWNDLGPISEESLNISVPKGASRSVCVQQPITPGVEKGCGTPKVSSGVTELSSPDHTYQKSMFQDETNLCKAAASEKFDGGEKVGFFKVYPQDCSELYFKDHFSKDSTSSVEVQPPSCPLPSGSLGWNISEPVADESFSISDNAPRSTNEHLPTAPYTSGQLGAPSVSIGVPGMSTFHQSRPKSAFQDKYNHVCEAAPKHFYFDGKDDVCKNCHLHDNHHNHHKICLDHVDGAVAEAKARINFLSKSDDAEANEAKQSTASFRTRQGFRTGSKLEFDSQREETCLKTVHETSQQPITSVEYGLPELPDSFHYTTSSRFETSLVKYEGCVSPAARYKRFP